MKINNKYNLSKTNSGLVPSNYLARITELPQPPLPAASGGLSLSGEYYGGEGLLIPCKKNFKRKLYLFKFIAGPKAALLGNHVAAAQSSATAADVNPSSVATARRNVVFTETGVAGANHTPPTGKKVKLS
jgi:hypothetical protein